MYFLAAAIGYISLIIFLGDPGKGLLAKGITKDVVLRRNFLIKTLSTGPSAADFFQSDAQFTGEWTLVTYSMATYALTNIAMLESKTAQESSQMIAQWIKYCLNEKVVAFDRVAWHENPLDSKVLGRDRGHIGYYAHLNLMLGCYALLNKDGQFKELHQSISAIIFRMLIRQKSKNSNHSS